jgi:hypothetical protein
VNKGSGESRNKEIISTASWLKLWPDALKALEAVAAINSTWQNVTTISSTWQNVTAIDSMWQSVTAINSTSESVTALNGTLNACYTIQSSLGHDLFAVGGFQTVLSDQEDVPISIQSFALGPLTKAFEGSPIAEASTLLDEDPLSEFATAYFRDIAALLSDEPESDHELAFANEFRNFILRYGRLGTRIFEQLCLGEGTRITVLVEGLRELGRMIDPNTVDARMQLLRKCLTHPSPIVRDAAGLGLSLMGDKRAVPFLERAVAAEKAPLCKLALLNSLDELRE